MQSGRRPSPSSEPNAPEVHSAGPPRLRTIRIIARLNVGGPARHTVIADAGLMARGFETLLVHGSVGADEASMEGLAEANGVRRVFVRALGRRIHLWDDFTACCRLIRLMFDVRPDVVHTHTAKAGAVGRLAATLYNMMRSRSRRAVIVHTFHGHVFEGYFGPAGTYAVRLIERRLATLTDVIVTISESQRRDIIERFSIAPAHKTQVIPLGLELAPLLVRPRSYAALRGELGWTHEHFVLGYVGRFAAIKQLPLLVSGFLALLARVPNARLLLVGDGESRAILEQLVESASAVHAVRLLGWRTDLTEVYGTLDAFALTSRNEGTPVSMIEAMAAGVPVVATAVGGVPDLVDHGRTGLLVPAGDLQALVGALLDLVTYPEAARSRADAARRRVEALYRPGRLLDDLQELYHTALRVKRGGSQGLTTAPRSDTARPWI